MASSQIIFTSHIAKWKKNLAITIYFICHVPFVSSFPHFWRGDLFFSLRVSWGRTPTRLEFPLPRRLPLSRCRAGERSDDKLMCLFAFWALLSLSIVELMAHLPVEISTAVLSVYLGFLPEEHGFLPCCWGWDRISYSVPSLTHIKRTKYEVGRLE